jgi:hypothetical protein
VEALTTGEPGLVSTQALRLLRERYDFMAA